ncbi:MAG: tRNA (adenosine(37)-N6)-dimethylallyltransferase MiaA [Nitriliruptoraceae bacterium]
MADHSQTVLALVGPTGAGKTATALDIAGDLASQGTPTEIVAIDAFTIYRDMDIATAKPSRDDRAQVPHHLVDVVDPDTDVTVAWFQQLARDAIAQVHGRDAMPLLVGGSGLYWRAVVDPFDFPPTELEVREQLDAYWQGRYDQAYEYLRELDPAAAEDIEPQNQRRIIRALEVIQITGQPFSTFKRAWKEYRSVYPDLRVVMLDPEDTVLRTAIWQRATAMVDGGLIDEAHQLRQRYELSRTARQAIGYAEAFSVLDGALAAADLADAIATRTWKYVRRQRAWFRADPRCQLCQNTSSDHVFTQLTADAT